MVIRYIYTGRGNRENVSGVNSNFAYLFGEMSNLWGFVNGKGDEILSSEAIQEMIQEWIDKNNFKVKPSVQTPQDLPSVAEVNEVRGVYSENSMYIYDGTQWAKTISLQNIDDFKSQINKNTSDLMDLKPKVEKNIIDIADLKENVSGNYINSENYSTLQEAIYAAENGTLLLKRGTYLIDTPLKVRSNTTIIGYGSVIKRNADINAMLLNDSDGTKGGYLSNANIKIVGIEFDAVKGQFVDQCTMVGIGHSENISIIDCTFRNLANWHMIEFNSTKNGLISGCLFKDYGTDILGTEMIQLDVAKESKVFPWFGLYDNTACENITIVNNRFENGDRGIGSHSYSQLTSHRNIKIINNTFIKMRREAIYGLDWEEVIVENNLMSDVWFGIQIAVQGKDCTGYTIKDNSIYGSTDSTARGIVIKGISGSFSANDGRITGNIVKNFSTHGIGIDYSSNWNVTDNEVYGCGKSGIIIYGVNNAVVSNNKSLKNNLENSGYADIFATKSSKGVVINGNICTSILTEVDATNVLAVSNIADSITIKGTGSKAATNIVKGVYTA